MSVLTRATRRNITEDGILHCHRLENLMPYRHTVSFCAEVSERSRADREEVMVTSPVGIGNKNHYPGEGYC
jgi:hypothetical protein